jgi:GTP-binding protein HflX
VPYRAGARARAGKDGASAGATRTPDDRLSEAVGLAGAIDLDVRASGVIPLGKLRPATLIGTGKVEELKGIVAEERLELVVLDHALSPGQQRNLEKELVAKVLDRTGLILEIFGRRARTREGQLQVELAHLTWQRSRLVRSWTHLERQRGGFGFLGGPGETQIETDRRLIGERIDSIEKELGSVVRTRGLHRGGRERVPYPVVALVGYTNAGKSTLFNRLTGADVVAKDMLFATLDPTMREIRLPSGRRAMLSDTVGFISELPTTLIAAFRATLEEVVAADLILHVRDVAHQESEAQARDVEKVLAGLGIEVGEAQSHIIEVWNKIDLLSPERRGEIIQGAGRALRPAVPVSAATGAGIDALLALVAERLPGGGELVQVAVGPAEGKLANWLHEACEVTAREMRDDGFSVLSVRLDKGRRAELDRRLARLGPERAHLIEPEVAQGRS